MAEEYFETALAVNEKLHAAPFLAHTQAEFSQTLRARGRSADLVGARERQAAAAATAKRLGMDRFLQLLRAEGVSR